MVCGLVQDRGCEHLVIAYALGDAPVPGSPWAGRRERNQRGSLKRNSRIEIVTRRLSQWPMPCRKQGMALFYCLQIFFMKRLVLALADARRLMRRDRPLEPVRPKSRDSLQDHSESATPSGRLKLGARWIPMVPTRGRRANY